MYPYFICVKVTKKSLGWINVLVSIKKLLIFFIFIKVKISYIFIVTVAKFFQNQGLAHLRYTLQKKRLAVREVFSSPAAFSK